MSLVLMSDIRYGYVIGTAGVMRRNRWRSSHRDHVGKRTRTHGESQAGRSTWECVREVRQEFVRTTGTGCVYVFIMSFKALRCKKNTTNSWKWAMR